MDQILLIQQVVVSGEYSLPYSITSGIPQGSVFGPVLFLLYMNDITNIQSQMHLFADDCLLYRIIASTHDLIVLQDDLNALTSRWNLVSLNVSFNMH